MLGRRAVVRCWRVYVAGALYRELHSLHQPAASRSRNKSTFQQCVRLGNERWCGTSWIFLMQFRERRDEWVAGKAATLEGVGVEGGWYKGQRGREISRNSRALETSQAVANFTRKWKRSLELLIFFWCVRRKVEIQEKTLLNENSLRFCSFNILRSIKLRLTLQNDFAE